jgi:hypothetical protein
LSGLHKLTAYVTVTAFGLYIISDLLEILFGELFQSQLILTYISMMLIPFSMMGLGSMSSRNGGVPFLVGTVLIAISFVYFSGTATFAFVEKVYRYEELVRRLGLAYLVHGVILVVGGLCFSVGAYQEKLFPRWALALIFMSSIISFFTGFLVLDENFYVLANFLRNAGFFFVGVSLIRRGTRSASPSVNSTRANVGLRRS